MTPPPEGPPGGRIRIDLHMHTRASFDCLSPAEAVLEAARRRGLGRIAVTDHNRLGAALELAARHPDEVIPGEEVKTAQGFDVIGLYLREEIPKGTEARETCLRIRDQGGLVYLPHPYARGKGGSGRWIDDVVDLVHVVEVFNARLHPAALNEAAEALARRTGLPRGAGSDAHTPAEVGRGCVEVPAHENRPEALLAALREGTVHAEPSSRLVHLSSTWAKVRKRLPGG